MRTDITINTFDTPKIRVELHDLSSSEDQWFNLEISCAPHQLDVSFMDAKHGPALRDALIAAFPLSAAPIVPTEDLDIPDDLEVDIPELAFDGEDLVDDFTDPNDEHRNF